MSAPSRMGGAEMTVTSSPNCQIGVESAQRLDGSTAKPKNIAEAAPYLAQQYRLLIEPGQVVELRALDVRRGGRPHIEAGFYDYEHLENLAKAALLVTQLAKGVYF